MQHDTGLLAGVLHKGSAMLVVQLEPAVGAQPYYSAPVFFNISSAGVGFALGAHRCYTAKHPHCFPTMQALRKPSQSRYSTARPLWRSSQAAALTSSCRALHTIQNLGLNQ